MSRVYLGGELGVELVVLEETVSRSVRICFRVYGVSARKIALQVYSLVCQAFYAFRRIWFPFRRTRCTVFEEMSGKSIFVSSSVFMIAMEKNGIQSNTNSNQRLGRLKSYFPTIEHASSADDDTRVAQS
jgi:hypothetical protein